MSPIKMALAALFLLLTSALSAAGQEVEKPETCSRIDALVRKNLDALNTYPSMSSKERLMGGEAQYNAAMRQLPMLMELRRQMGCGAGGAAAQEPVKDPWRRCEGSSCAPKSETCRQLDTMLERAMVQANDSLYRTFAKASGEELDDAVLRILDMKIRARCQ